MGGLQADLACPPFVAVTWPVMVTCDVVVIAAGVDGAVLPQPAAMNITAPMSGRARIAEGGPDAQSIV